MDMGSSTPLGSATCRVCSQVIPLKGLDTQGVSLALAKHALTHGVQVDIPDSSESLRVSRTTADEGGGLESDSSSSAFQKGSYEAEGAAFTSTSEGSSAALGDLFGDVGSRVSDELSSANESRSALGAPPMPFPAAGASGAAISSPLGGNFADKITDGAEKLAKTGVQKATGNAATGGAEKNVVKAVGDIAKIAADRERSAGEKYDDAAFVVGKEGSKAAAKAGLAYIGAGAVADPLVENKLVDKVADQAGKQVQRTAGNTAKAVSKSPTGLAAKKAANSAAGQALLNKGKAGVDKVKKVAGGATKPLGAAAKPFKFALGMPAKTKGVLAAAVAATLVAGLAFVGGAVLTVAATPQDSASGYLWDVEPNIENLNMPASYLDAYVAAGRAANVPWTLIAAVGARASAHGRVDPYKQDVPEPFAGSLTTPAPTAAGQREKPNKVYVLAADESGDPVETTERLTAAFDGSGLAVTVKVTPPVTATADWALNQLRNVDLPVGSKVVLTVGQGDLRNPKFRTSATKLMQHLSGVDVTWLTVDAPSNEQKVNNVLFDLQAKFPGELRVADWNAAADTNGNQVAQESGQPPQLTPEASQAKADFVKAYATGQAASTTLGQPAGAGLAGPGVLPEPTGSCPTLVQPITGPSPNRGFGPLMLSPAALSMTTPESQEDLQNICRSSNILANAMAKEAQAAAASMGLVYPASFVELVDRAKQGDAQAAQLVQNLWVKVMGNLDVLGSTDKRHCIAEPQPTDLPFEDYVVGTIRTVWGCVLSGAKLNTVVDVESVDGNLTFDILPRAEARRRAVAEAIEVAWVYSQWGKALAPTDNERPSPIGCNPKAPLAGVFPLTEATFNQYLPKRLEGATRCDAEASIVAAAWAFADGESTAPEVRRGGATGYLAMQGGWSQFAAAVTGPDAVQERFAERGPYREVSVPNECAAAMQSSVASTTLDSSNPLAGVPEPVLNAYANGKGKLPPAVPGQFDAYLVNALPALADIPECAELPAGLWAKVVIAASSVSDGTPPAAPAGSPIDSVPPSLASAIARATPVYAATKLISARPVKPQVGTTATLQRLSPALLGSAGMPTIPQWAPLTDRGSDLVSIAMSVYGGMYASGTLVAGGAFSGTNCPQQAPPNTLRDGAEAIGILEICQQAVAQAATPQAALAVQWALNNLGKKYAWPVGVNRDGPDMYDCSSFVSHAYYDTTGIGIAGEGWSHSTRNQMPWGGVPLDPRYEKVPNGQERPGDLVMQTTPSASSEHVLMYLGEINGVRWVAHTNMPGDVSKVEDMPSSGVVGYRRVVPVTEEEKAKVAAAAATLGTAALGPVGPSPGAGRGGVWLAKFLYSKGLRGDLLRTVWTIGMRESGANPGLTTNGGTENWGYDGSPHYDVGLFQINNRHLERVRTLFGKSADMRLMLDYEKNYQLSQSLSKNWTYFLAWGLTPEGNFDWSLYPADWLAKYQAASERWTKTHFAAFPATARQAGIPGY